MIYVRLRDNFFPCYEGDIRVEHPEIGDHFVCPPTFQPLEPNPAPAHDEMTHKAAFGSLYQKDGRWCVDLVLSELSETEKANKARKPSEVERNPFLKAIRKKIEKEMS